MEPSPQTILPPVAPAQLADSSNKHNSWKWIALAILALAVGVVGGWLGAHHFSKSTSPSSSTTASSTKSSSSANATETVKTKFSLDYTPSSGAAQQSVPASFSMTVPLALRTQITDSSCFDGLQGNGDAGGSQLAECLRLSFADELGSGDSLVNNDNMSVWDSYNWLRSDEDPNGIPIFGLSTSAQKQQAWQALLGINPSSNLNATLKQLPDLATDAAYVAGTQKLTYIQSADGNLKGMAFVATVAQDEAYDPSVWFILGGTIGGQPTMVTGSFHASDPTVTQINSLVAQDNQSTQAEQLITQANDKFSAGHLSPQTSQAFDQVVAMLKSIRISAT